LKRVQELTRRWYWMMHCSCPFHHRSYPIELIWSIIDLFGTIQGLLHFGPKKVLYLQWSQVCAQKYLVSYYDDMYKMCCDLHILEIIVQDNCPSFVCLLTFPMVITSKNIWRDLSGVCWPLTTRARVFYPNIDHESLQ
jgi:hypothetical protein